MNYKISSPVIFPKFSISMRKGWTRDFDRPLLSLTKTLSWCSGLWPTSSSRSGDQGAVYSPGTVGEAVQLVQGPSSSCAMTLVSSLQEKIKKKFIQGPAGKIKISFRAHHLAVLWQWSAHCRKNKKNSSRAHRLAVPWQWSAHYRKNKKVHPGARAHRLAVPFYWSGEIKKFIQGPSSSFANCHDTGQLTTGTYKINKNSSSRAHRLVVPCQ